MLIKICGVKSPETAYFAAKRGADMVGIVCYLHSRRYVSLPLAREIATAAVDGGAIPVMVFKDTTAAEVLAICEALNVYTVQVHGVLPKLPATFTRIIANGKPSQLISENDFLLFDNSVPGSGIPFDWGGFQPPQGIRWFLSGGLTPDNVVEGIQLLHPTGVDVSSGVEQDGIKVHALIEKFIARVRGYE